MKQVLAVLAAFTLLGSPAFAADPWNGENGDRSSWEGDWDEDHASYGYPQEYRRYYAFGALVEEFRDGDCEIERRWEEDGDYKEERDCD
jgi:opacity protein-like surface antigen